MELEKDKIEFRTEEATKFFEISMGWYGCCQYENEIIELNKEECKELIKELEEYVKEKK